MIDKPANKNKKIKCPGAFVTQPISQPDKRQKNTGVPLPDNENIIFNKEWVDDGSKL
ncbi:MAG: DUF3787 domain-containing protein [Clostridiales bacterium]|nr:DUF3787 domain-containing protein [Clostridiales bacterium]